MGESESCQIIVSCAAVADFRPKHREAAKIKRGKEDLVLELEPTADIAAALGAKKKSGTIISGVRIGN